VNKTPGVDAILIRLDPRQKASLVTRNLPNRFYFCPVEFHTSYLFLWIASDFRRTSPTPPTDDEAGLIIVGVYVDDLTIAARNITTLESFKRTMSLTYEMKDPGELHFTLGLEVIRDRASRTLQPGQKQYVTSILKRFSFEDCREASTPLPAKTVLVARAPNEASTDKARYLSAVGSLMYAMLGTTRHSICCWHAWSVCQRSSGSSLDCSHPRFPISCPLPRSGYHLQPIKP
jgi:hypothetical protein